ncbi:MAG: glycosyltransferase family 2 protein [Alphaproteobacteria bacterium]
MIRMSVVVPVYNTARHLERCIAALRGQDYPADEFEILAVDNNSTDESPAILARAAGVRVLHERKQGSYAARNRAVREARGALLAFTDSDCIPDRGWLRAIEAAMADPGVQVVLGLRRPSLDHGVVKLIGDYEVKKDELVFSSTTPEVYYGYTNDMGVRRTTFDRYGPFVERDQVARVMMCSAFEPGPGGWRDARW